MERITNDSDPLPPADVHVIGGGLGGLAAAALVARSGRSVVVHEQLGSLGGRAVSDDVNGFRFNRGPHALYTGGEGVAVLRRLGVTPTGSPPATAGARMAFGGRTYLAPGDVASLLRTGLLGLRDKVELASALRRLTTLDAAGVAALTVRQLVDDVTTRERVAAVVHAVVRLTSYVNAPDELSADVAVGQLQRGLDDGVVYLDHGWQQLVDVVAAAVIDAGGSIRTGHGPLRLPEAPAVIVAVGGPAAASALVDHDYPAAVPSYVSSLDLGLRRVPPHRFVLGVDEPIYLSDHGRPVGMTPDGAASVSLANYLAPGDKPDRHRLETFARGRGNRGRRRGRGAVPSPDDDRHRDRHRRWWRLGRACRCDGARSAGRVRRGRLGGATRPSRRRRPRERGGCGHRRGPTSRTATGGAMSDVRSANVRAANVRASEFAVFESERARLRGLAYRMTGTPDDADDMVQEAWIRWQRVDRSTIENPAAWLTTVTSRLALDRLTSAKARREQYVGPWLPEPLATAAEPDELVAAADSLTLGFMRVLETLQPVERAVFLLHDVFEMPFGEVAAAVDRNEPATRQIAKRARDRVRAGSPAADGRAG